MKTLSVRDTDDAVSSLSALQDVLSSELAALESRIQTMESGANDNTGGEGLSEQKLTRTVLLSGLTSIEEVMGWVRLVASKDPEGNDLDCVQSLPELSVVHTNRIKLLPN